MRRAAAGGRGGLPIEEREQVIFFVPHNFPFKKPSAWVPHDRFAGFPHVQWKHSLCLYQAPSTEWNPSDGMFGFLDRLQYWYAQGALGQLDPVGAPLHPPVAYTDDGPMRSVVPRADTPAVAGEAWFGTAHLRTHSDTRVDIVGWSPVLDTATPTGVAAAILLAAPFPYEFPERVSDLIRALDERGVPKERLFNLLQWAVLHNAENTPLYMVLGTAMRGVRGGELRQHLTAWYIEPVFAWALKTALDKFADEPEARELGEKVERIVMQWADTAKVSWCTVLEDRPEIVARRDCGSPLEWFKGRTVAVWGCGALGGHAAEYLARAGAKKLILRDKGIITPGILVRQPFGDSDIGTAKVAALRARLLGIRPDLEIEVSTSSILNDPLGGDDWVQGADVILDATASTAVLGLLERRRWASEAKPIPVVSMAIGHDAQRGMVVVTHSEHSGGPMDANRRLKLAATTDARPTGYLDEFWPAAPRPFFQPEPGCSDATFVGSAADVAGLTADMLNLGAADLARRETGVTATGHFVVQPLAAAAGDAARASFQWGADVVCFDAHAGYQVRIEPSAWRRMRNWIERSKNERGPEVETGGLLFGERDESAGIVWVSEVSGPPPDSSASAKKFVCGVVGTAEMNAEKRSRTRGSVHYLGMWHTHPDSFPVPSQTDWAGMRKLVKAIGGAGKALMLIVGCPHSGAPMLGTYVFQSSDFDAPPRKTDVRLHLVQIIDWERGLQSPGESGGAGGTSPSEVPSKP